MTLIDQTEIADAEVKYDANGDIIEQRPPVYSQGRDFRGRFAPKQRSIFSNVPRRTLQVQVKRGAALLDKHRPGWWAEVDTETLDISDSQLCIAGQCDAYGLPDSLHGHGMLGWSFADDDNLTRMWKHQIKKRIEHAKTQTTIDSLVSAAHGLIQASRGLHGSDG